jgi:hypothetical protein
VFTVLIKINSRNGSLSITGRTGLQNANEIQNALRLSRALRAKKKREGVKREERERRGEKKAHLFRLLPFCVLVAMRLSSPTSAASPKGASSGALITLAGLLTENPG